MATINLTQLPANQTWAFTFGDALLRMQDWPMFFQDRKDAVWAAQMCGLTVSRSGAVATKTE
jgi:hypothetical protein